MNPSLFGGDAQGQGTGKLVPVGRERTAPRVVDASIVMPDGAGTLQTEVERMRQANGRPLSTTLRRLLFVWLRIYVNSSKRGKQERVNLAIPVPIPLVGAFFPGRVDFTQALKAVNLAHEDPQSAGPFLESCMALELIRVETDYAERDKRELVVIGLD